MSAQGNQAPPNSERCPKLLELSGQRMSSWTRKAFKHTAGNTLVGATEVGMGYPGGPVQLPVPLLALGKCSLSI